MKQGELNGILKELGYTEDQVSLWYPTSQQIFKGRLFSGLQVLSRYQTICYRDLNGIS